MSEIPLETIFNKRVDKIREEEKDKGWKNTNRPFNFYRKEFNNGREGFTTYNSVLEELNDE
jgi:hypothetical protein